MSETIPPNWWRDQYDAASRDNFRHTIRAAMIDAAMSPHYGIAVPSGTSFWERERQRIIRAWSAGEMRSCTHNPSPGAPQPVYVFLWRPDLIVCQRCTMIANALSEIEDRTCDGCGRVVAGTADDPMYTPTAVCGPLTIITGRCRRCLPDMGYAEAAE